MLYDASHVFEALVSYALDWVMVSQVEVSFEPFDPESFVTEALLELYEPESEPLEPELELPDEPESQEFPLDEPELPEDP